MFSWPNGGSLDFGQVDLVAEASASGFLATGEGKARIPGTGGKDLSAAFTITESKMNASGDIKLWGVRIKGGLKFAGFTLQETTLSSGFNLAGIAGGKLKLKLTTKNTSISATGRVSGKSYTAGVSSKGCFHFGVKFCL